MYIDIILNLIPITGMDGDITLMPTCMILIYLVSYQFIGSKFQG